MSPLDDDDVIERIRAEARAGPSRPESQPPAHGGRTTPLSATSPLAPSIHLSAVYRIEGLDQIDALYEGRAAGFIYARDGHPNAAQLAAKIAALEGAEAALVCASGMAAEAAVFLAGVGQGDAIALSEGLYGRSVALAARELARFGVEHQTFDATRPETLAAVLTPATRLVFAETLSNPLVRLADIEGLAAVAHGSGARLVIDHTFAPLLCRPIALGADAVTHSVTKLIGGHSDLTLGLLAGSRAIVDRAAVLASTFGLTGNPFESWLALRGVATLALRSARLRDGFDPGPAAGEPQAGCGGPLPGAAGSPRPRPRRAAPDGRLRHDRDHRPRRAGRGRRLHPRPAAHPLRAQPGRRGHDPQPSRNHQPPQPVPRAMGAAGDHPGPRAAVDRPGRPRRSLGGSRARRCRGAAEKP